MLRIQYLSNSNWNVWLKALRPDRIPGMLMSLYFCADGTFLFDMQMLRLKELRSFICRSKAAPAVRRKNPWNASLLAGFHSEASGVSRWCWGRLGKQGRMRSQPPGPPPEWRNQLKGLSLLSRLFSAEIPPGWHRATPALFSLIDFLGAGGMRCFSAVPHSCWSFSA